MVVITNKLSVADIYPPCAYVQAVLRPSVETHVGIADVLIPPGFSPRLSSVLHIE